MRIEHETRTGQARLVTDPDERHRVGDVMGAKYVWDGDPAIESHVPGVVLRRACRRRRVLTAV